MGYSRAAPKQRRTGAIVRMNGSAGRRLRLYWLALGALLAVPLFVDSAGRLAKPGGARAGTGMTAERARARSVEMCRVLLPPDAEAPVQEVAAYGNEFTGRVWQVAAGVGSGPRVHFTWDADTSELMDVATDPGVTGRGPAVRVAAAAAEPALDAGRVAEKARGLSALLRPATPPHPWRLAAGDKPRRQRESWIVELEGAPGETATFSLAADTGAVRFARFDRRER